MLKAASVHHLMKALRWGALVYRPHCVDAALDMCGMRKNGVHPVAWHCKCCLIVQAHWGHWRRLAGMGSHHSSSSPRCVLAACAHRRLIRCLYKSRLVPRCKVSGLNHCLTLEYRNWYAWPRHLKHSFHL